MARISHSAPRTGIVLGVAKPDSRGRGRGGPAARHDAGTTRNRPLENRSEGQQPERQSDSRNVSQAGRVPSDQHSRC